MSPDCAGCIFSFQRHPSVDNLADMCQKATCTTCKKTSWWGCGNHVPVVLDRIPAAQRCSCESPIKREGKTYPHMAHDPGFLVRNLANGILWARGRKAGYSPEGVVEVER